MDGTDPRVVRTRARIVEATVDLLAEVGIAEASMDAVATRAGIARSTLYRHFSDFGELLQVVLEELNPPQEPAEGDLESRIVETFVQMGRALRDRPWGLVVSSVIERAQRDDAMRDFYTRFTRERRRPIIEATEEGQRDGTFRDDFDPERFTTAVAGSIYYQHLVLREPLSDEAIRSLAAAAVESLRPREA